MKTGKLYSHAKNTIFWPDAKVYPSTLLEKNEPFFLLEVVSKVGYKSCKVLNSEGIIGWINITEYHLVKEVAANT